MEWSDHELDPYWIGSRNGSFSSIEDSFPSILLVYVISLNLLIVSFIIPSVIIVFCLAKDDPTKHAGDTVSTASYEMEKTGRALIEWDDKDGEYVQDPYEDMWPDNFDPENIVNCSVLTPSMIQIPRIISLNKEIQTCWPPLEMSDGFSSSYVPPEKEDHTQSTRISTRGVVPCATTTTNTTVKKTKRSPSRDQKRVSADLRSSYDAKGSARKTGTSREKQSMNTGRELRTTTQGSGENGTTTTGVGRTQYSCTPLSGHPTTKDSKGARNVGSMTTARTIKKKDDDLSILPESHPKTEIKTEKTKKTKRGDEKRREGGEKTDSTPEKEPLLP